jgi:hypothetical protein
MFGEVIVVVVAGGGAHPWRSASRSRTALFKTSTDAAYERTVSAGGESAVSDAIGRIGGSSVGTWQ